ncbi:MAG: Fe-S cluster assembly sulfur transfer protein SufU [Nanoarchaeota archaeon]
MINRLQVGEGILTEEQEIYRENILDHYKRPHNTGKLQHYTCSNRELNPLCGDELEIFLHIDNGRVKEITFIGKGCAISQASMSMLTDVIKGKLVREILTMTKDDIVNMLGIPIGAVRMKCAMLSLQTVHKSLKGVSHE